MQCYCKLSGIEFQVSTFTHKASIQSVHPIFYATDRQLYNREADFYLGRLNADEKRLLFCAMLKSTNLVEFTTTATPSTDLVNKQMEWLFKFFNWKMDTIFQNAHFPRYIIRAKNANLANIGEYLRELNAFANPEYYRRAIRRRRDSLVTKEAALERLIKSNVLRRSVDFRTNMANWFLDAVDAPEHVHDEWRRLMMYDYDDFKLYKEDSDKLESILLWAEDKLEHGTIYSNTILAHLRELVVANVNGVEYFLGLHKQSGKLANGEDFMIVDEIEQANIEAITASAPALEPKREDFLDKHQYFIALAKYKLAAAQRTKIASSRAELVQRNIDAAIDNDIAQLSAEEAEDEANDDALNAVTAHFRSI